MTTRSLSATELASRRAPAFGGLNAIALSIEIRRLLRNRRTLIFTMIMPSIFFLLFGLNSAYANDSNGKGAYGNVSAFVLISMALYGATLATTSGGAMVSIERAAGWSRQLRLTPLASPAYVGLKMLTSLVLGLGSVAAVFIVGGVTGKPSMPVWLWVVSALCVWVGSLVFAAFGLFLGYLLPTENVMQFLGFIMMLFSFGGGVFIPLSQYPHVLRDIAEYTPLYGLNQLVHAPLLNSGVDIAWVGNAIAWLIIFTAGAAWRFRKDTARV
ncbi:MAG TPA: ABC transporter permease [Streptosporangiaceae bacterium]|jgi:ABC-2 type transport system permease protein|nr:ABC transporter permease [Streptosporangiaceae bacterium]